MKQYIGKPYADEKHIPWLKGYSFVEGSVISPLNDVAQFSVPVFKLGNALVAVFFNRESSTDKSFAILDVLEIKNIRPFWKLRISDCDNGNEGATNIVALVQARKGKNDIILKAWRCNMDKIRLDALSTKLVHCSGYEQF